MLGPYQVSKPRSVRRHALSIDIELPRAKCHKRIRKHDNLSLIDQPRSPKHQLLITGTYTWGRQSRSLRHH